MDSASRQFVRDRARLQCEYCRLAEDHSPVAKHQIEHIVPRKHGGDDHTNNLALACIDCNLHKGSNLTGIDPDSSLVTELFHPRQQSWSEHFRFNGVEISGLTACGRTTVRVLDMNSEDRVQLRMAIAGLG